MHAMCCWLLDICMVLDAALICTQQIQERIGTTIPEIQLDSTANTAVQMQHPAGRAETSC